MQGVDVVFSEDEHVYETIKPENNIYYFVLGAKFKSKALALTQDGRLAVAKTMSLVS